MTSLDTPEKTPATAAGTGEAKKMKFEDEQFAVAVVDYNAADAAKKLTDSLKTTGFAVLTNSPVSNDLIQSVYSKWREFMIKLNSHAKEGKEAPENLALKYKYNMGTQDGYFPTAVSEKAKGASVRLRALLSCSATCLASIASGSADCFVVVVACPCGRPLSMRPSILMSGF